MQHSTKRILTTHAGSLPRPADLLAMIEAKERGEAVDAAAQAARVVSAVNEVVQKQIALGIDVIDDGEYSKPSFTTYANERLGGFELDAGAPRKSPWDGTREALSFPEFYAIGHVASRQQRMVCTAPVTYTGHKHVQQDIANLKAALNGAQGSGAKVADVFMPAISPSNIEEWRRNTYYKTQE
jgi:5-methyltetrahydropteroyltriglutamate--homocysteine methyltransferase